MMNAQICHSQIGAEIRMPIANDMRSRRSKAAGDGAEHQLDLGGVALGLGDLRGSAR